MSADKDLVSVQQARDFVEAAHKAGGQLAKFDQGKIDRICEAMVNAALVTLHGWVQWPWKKPATAFRRTKRSKQVRCC